MILENLNMPVLSMKEAGIETDIEENGTSFEENALIKARAVAACAGPEDIVLADDSGLEIDYLNGEPGIYSARYMGEDTSYRIKNANLIERLDGVPKEQRTARFVCAIAAVLINSPNNPSGVVYSEETIRTLAEILNRKQEEYGHDIFLISDEPYREIVFDGKQAPYVSCYYANTISCYSFSKSLSLPGERIGYVAVNPACREAETIVNMCGQISRGTGHNCPPSLIQLAVAQVIDQTADLSVYETNMKLLYDCLVKLGFTCVRPGGTFYIFPKALEEDANAFCQKALAYDLILVPGDTFGCPGYFRMAYCIDTEKVIRSLKALESFVRTEYGR